MEKVNFYDVELMLKNETKWKQLPTQTQQELIAQVRRGLVKPVLVNSQAQVIDGEEVVQAAIEAKIKSLSFVVVAAEIQEILPSIPPGENSDKSCPGSQEVLKVTQEQCQAWANSQEAAHTVNIKLDRFCVFARTPAELQRVLQAMQEIHPANLSNRKMSAKNLIRMARTQKAQKLLSGAVTELTRPGVDLRFGDFRILGNQIADNTIDGVDTDPPYDRGSIELYYESATLAMRVLKPGGIYIAYAGKMFLPAVYAALERSGLEFVWQGAIIHNGGHNVTWPRRMISGYKPIIIYRKPSHEAIQWPLVLDVCSSGKQEQDLHPWQQSLSESEYFIRKFFVPGSTILDPMMGSGTTIVAAINCGMKAIGMEQDPVTFETAKKRIEDHLTSLEQNIENEGA